MYVRIRREKLRPLQHENASTDQSEIPHVHAVVDSQC